MIYKQHLFTRYHNAGHTMKYPEHGTTTSLYVTNNTMPWYMTVLNGIMLWITCSAFLLNKIQMNHFSHI